MRYNDGMRSRIDSKWEQKTDPFVDGILEILLFPLYGAAIVLPFIGLTALLALEIRSGILYLLSGVAAYCLGRCIVKYFDYKKGYRS